MLSAYGLAVDLELPVPELAGLTDADVPAPRHLRVLLAQSRELDERWSGQGEQQTRASAVVDGTPWTVERGQAGDLRMSHALARFHLDGSGTTLYCAPADADAPAWRRLLLDTALVTASLANGLEALHGGAIVHEGRAVVIAGPAGAGKTTLVAELLGRGATLLADDIVALERVSEAVLLAHPGPPLANLPPGIDIDRIGQRLHRFGTETWVLVDEYARAPVELGLIVILDRSADEEPARFELVEQPAALLLAHALHSGSAPARREARFELLADVAASTPVASLTAGADVPAAALADRIHASLVAGQRS